MPALLSQNMIEQYHRDGFVGGIDVLTSDEVRHFRSELEKYETSIGSALGFPDKTKPYLLFEWADSIVHHPKVLDAVQDVIGPDILVYHTTLWTKEPNTETFVIWHQDDAYFHLDPPEQITAWVALTEADELAGCMRMIPGIHKEGYIEHTDNPHQKNLIRRGQGIHGRFSDAEGSLVPNRAGQMSLHNTHTPHASGPNRGQDRRIGLGISYIPTHVRPQTDPRSSTLLVRGVDRYQHFHPEKRLQATQSMAERRAAHAEANRLYLAATRILEGA
jgi:non-heme Fe2+,alpha-ketoglutarate-dependent halogenase